jgi:transcription elongation GreA/GreB family factor
MKPLEEALDAKLAELKQKPYPEIEAIVSDVKLFCEDHKGRSYAFELQAQRDNDGEIRVMVECSRNLPLLAFFGKHRYFSMAPDGTTKEIDAKKYWT